ncbi:MAG: methyltransferase domain-containing protein [Rhodospirillaceae bacterium]|nr:methyltransferase domain-containing protein [Rhodospirillaceae bacterium]
MTFDLPPFFKRSAKHAITAAMADSMLIFDRNLVRRHRDRAAAHIDHSGFLFAESAARLVDRIDDTTRTFELALDLGCRDGVMARALSGSARVKLLVQCDLSAAMARRARANHGLVFCADEEVLPVADGIIDLVLSNLALHWTNDLPGALVQLRRALKPDGLLLASIFGGDTLSELRSCLLEAETRLTGGASPRVSPFADVRDAGALLQRAGFALPVVDADTIVVTYPDIFRLMADLRAMGETNAVRERVRHPPPRELFALAGQIYAERFADSRGRLVATFQIVTLTAWTPHAGQPKALRPGSAAARLADALGGNEVIIHGTKP